jgi:predicted AlkP superfamily phosphohydrolase/phosphomutase
MGWAIDTWSVSEKLGSERQSLEDAEYTADRFTDLMRSELARQDTDLYVQVFAFTDRIQHIFLRFADPTHPAYDVALATEFQHAVRDSYVKMDEIVGEARRLAPKDALFLVLSDHGFAQFRRGVNINRWLVNHGYMVLSDDPCVRGGDGRRSLDDLFEDTSGTFAGVDWSKTKAYALGLGNIYVNLAGRESQGIVRPGREYRELVEKLSRELEALVDPLTGERPVAAVHHRDASYEGYDPVLIPDLRAANTPGYRVSWDTSLGGAPCEEIQDNLKAWGADHCSLEPELVKGILFSNHGFADGDPEMADLAPTILKALGLETPEHADGRALE